MVYVLVKVFYSMIIVLSKENVEYVYELAVEFY